MIYTSLNEIKSFNPCATGWKNILLGQRKTMPDNALFPLTEALKSNSVSDVCWLLGKREKEIQVCVRFAKMCADSVKHLNNRESASYNSATYAASAASAANAASADADYAADAANAAAYAACAASAACAAADYAEADYATQQEKNKQFLIQCIEEYVK
jgi:hypothetical protein